MNNVHVEQGGLDKLGEVLATAGSDYKEKLGKLKNLMNEITNGDIKGTPAKQLLDKFNEKEDTFNSLQTTLDKLETYIQLENTKFGTSMSNIEAIMK